jgi:hypothetical protein
MCKWYAGILHVQLTGMVREGIGGPSYKEIRRTTMLVLLLGFLNNVWAIVWP